MNREEYVKRMRQLLGRDPEAIRDANRALYVALVDTDGGQGGDTREPREADLVLAEIAQ